MTWYTDAIFYHIYPLGLANAPAQNDYGTPVSRLRKIFPWIKHIRNLGCNAIYIGPLFESVGHGYETTNYKKLDSRLGTNEDLSEFISLCHNNDIRVIVDGVFNHTGRDFFAFQDIKKNRESSPYRDWYKDVNFHGNNEYNDGFSYQNWGGYNLLAALNQQNPEVRTYLLDVVRYWVEVFDIDGIRLDAADVLGFELMYDLRKLANEIKEDFWLMGEVIHGDYSRWVNEETLHSVTNYHLHKALYSGHNDYNYFEIAHTVQRLYDMNQGNFKRMTLYNFVDNHDVERIYTKLNIKGHMIPVHFLLYTLPGIPSIYYGSEFCIEGKKENFSDASLRPSLSLEECLQETRSPEMLKLIHTLAKVRTEHHAFSEGKYSQLLLTNRQYAFARFDETEYMVVAVNNDDTACSLQIHIPEPGILIDVITKEEFPVTQNSSANITIPGNNGRIFIHKAD